MEHHCLRLRQGYRDNRRRFGLRSLPRLENLRIARVSSSQKFLIQTTHFVGLVVISYTVGSLSEDVFQGRTSSGSEPFSLFICLDSNKFVSLSFFSLIKTIYPRVSTKPLPNDAKSPLPVDVRRSTTLLLKLPSISSQQLAFQVGHQVCHIWRHAVPDCIGHFHDDDIWLQLPDWELTAFF